MSVRVPSDTRNFWSNERSFALIDASPDAMLIFDARGRIDLVNQRAASLFGYRRDAMRGLPVEALIPVGSRERHAHLRDGYARSPHLRPTGSALECSAVRADGGEFPAEISLSPVEIEGESFVIAAVRDVSERKRFEAELELRARQQRAIARLGLESLETQGDLDAFLGAACRHLRTALGVDYTEILELRPDVDSVLLHAGAGWTEGTVGRTFISNGDESLAGYALATGGPVIVPHTARETRFKIPDLLLQHGVTSSITTIIHGREGPYGMLGAASVTERAFEPADVDVLQTVANLIAQVIERCAADAALRRAQQQQQQLLSDRTTELNALRQEFDLFLNSLAHDLRTPLRGIDGYSYLLEEEQSRPLEAHSREYLEKIRSGAQRLGHLMDDLLTLSRISRQELQRGEVDISRLASRAVARQRQRFPGASLQVRVAPGLVVTGDPGLLELAICELIDNALKFSRKRKQAIVEIGCEVSEGGAVYFVRDNGVGFDPAYAHKLFLPFSRLHIEGDFEGRGIGLTLAQRALGRHGGAIWARSRADQGATFYFSVPAPSANDSLSLTGPAG